MTRNNRIAAALLGMLVCATGVRAQGTEGQIVQSAVAAQPARSVLDLPARLNVLDVPLEAALLELARASGVPLAFSPARLPSGVRTSCACDDTPVRDALDNLLDGTALRYMELSGQVVLFPPPADVPRNSPLLFQNPTMLARHMLDRVRGATAGGQSTKGSNGDGGSPSVTSLYRERAGAITGTVTEEGSNRPLANVQVLVDGAGRAITDAEGRFRIANVPPGPRTVTASSIGYRRVSRAVQVADGATVTVDLVMEISPSPLTEIVVTATGEQRRLELGHVVGTIRADSLVREAPVSNVTELLTARVPGMQVIGTQGMVGGNASVRIRGATSTLLSLDPVVIVDGVRYFSTANPSRGSGFDGHEPASRLNDLNPNDIETIEVVKGPSAVTLYGTDAVNGVIVITTKRGEPGRTRWSVYSRATTSSIAQTRYEDGYRGVSATTNNCRLTLVAAGTCIQEGIERVTNPLNDPALTIFSAAPRWEWGGNVQGGSEAARYYLSADYENATGPIRMPVEVIERLKEQRGVSELPPEQIRPNVFSRVNLRSNVSMGLGDRFSLQANAGYTQNATRSTSNLYSPYGSLASFGAGTEENPYGTSNSPDRAFSATSTENVNRTTGSVRLDVQPLNWMTAWASLGLDMTSTHRVNLALPGQGTVARDQGLAGDIRQRDILTTADLAARASYRHGRVGAQTVVGAQYLSAFGDGVVVTGSDLPPGGKTVATAVNRIVSDIFSHRITLGGYVEQSLHLNERLFLTGALRGDGASTFGRDYSAAMYPKFSASWLLSEEPFVPVIPGLAGFRIRYAFGISGRQPVPDMSLPIYSRWNYAYQGELQPTLRLARLGNLDLRPERTAEHEFGFDASLFAQRVHLETTWYYRTTTDGIQIQPLPPGFNVNYINVGMVKDRGFEAQAAIAAIDTRRLALDLTLQHSSNVNRLVSLGDANPNYAAFGSMVEGYPIGARFMVPLISWEDSNGDGIIERSEIVMGDSAVYMGPSIPPTTQAIGAVVGLFERRLRVSALLDRRAGNVEWDLFTRNLCFNGYCRGAVDPETPLDVQAQIVALGISAPGQASAANTVMHRGDFVRLRELGLMFVLPQRTVAVAGMRSASISLSARNVAVWSSSSTADPESTRRTGLLNNAHGGIPGVPQARSFILRFDIGF